MALRRAAHAVAFHPLRALQRLNRVAVQKAPLRESFRAELEEYFSVDAADLEQLLGRRLWPSLRSARRRKRRNRTLEMVQQWCASGSRQVSVSSYSLPSASARHWGPG